MSNPVYFIKNLAGEMLVGYYNVDFSNDEVHRILKPVYIMPLGPNQVGFQALKKFIKKDQIDIRKEHCFICEEASNEIAAAYVESVSSIQQVSEAEARSSGLILS